MSTGNEFKSNHHHNDETSEKVKRICEDIIGYSVEREMELITSGVLDSYLWMELVVELEKEFVIELLPEEIRKPANFNTIKSITNMLIRRKNNV